MRFAPLTDFREEPKMPLVDDVDKPQLLEVILGAPNPFDRLFIFTGTAIFDWPHNPPTEDDLIHESFDVNLSEVHFRPFVLGGATQVVASAALSSIHGTKRAGEVTWAVDRVFADVSADGELILHVDVAIQGKGGRFARFAYQAFVQASGMSIVEAHQIPPGTITVTNAPADFEIKLDIGLPNTTGGRVFVSVFLDDIVRGTTEFGVPGSINVLPGDKQASIRGKIQPNFVFVPGTHKLDIVFGTTIGTFRHSITIQKT
jgi:hypothetical protein